MPKCAASISQEEPSAKRAKEQLLPLLPLTDCQTSDIVTEQGIDNKVIVLEDKEDVPQASTSRLLRPHYPRSRPSHKAENLFMDLEAQQDDKDDKLDDEEEEEEDAYKHDLSEAIARIEVNANSRGSTSAPCPPYILRKRMYLFTVNVPARQYLAKKMEKKACNFLTPAGSGSNRSNNFIIVEWAMGDKPWDSDQASENGCRNSFKLSKIASGGEHSKADEWHNFICGHVNRMKMHLLHQAVIKLKEILYKSRIKNLAHDEDAQSDDYIALEDIDKLQLSHSLSKYFMLEASQSWAAMNCQLTLNFHFSSHTLKYINTYGPAYAGGCFHMSKPLVFSARLTTMDMEVVKLRGHSWRSILIQELVGHSF
ncbi:hypothetical protein DEU56DRAFT_759410 [Suillus clintonianus]|uniref:uncharacterized protein n=1 Tax=Suillus clintonianus TaxID=1904413 RepID=UPI001B87E255|nr:uncharacterized protein DEU56DRAFT_759410 [Suillus clintonianus]KAG2125168.1 hypothetical protein DEU56DRAFT_759410 [Suillus clintonianus]